MEGVPTTVPKSSPPQVHSLPYTPHGTSRSLSAPTLASGVGEWIYVVIYKEAGIPTVNTAHRDRRATALYLLSQHYKKTNPQAKLFMVSRLDRSTAGFVVFAKSAEAKELLVRQWGKLLTEQRFAACIEGAVPAPSIPIRERYQSGGQARRRVAESNYRSGNGAEVGRQGRHARCGDKCGAGPHLFGTPTSCTQSTKHMGDVRSSSGFESRGTIA